MNWPFIWDRILFVITHLVGLGMIVLVIIGLAALFGSFVNAKAHGRRWP